MSKQDTQKKRKVDNIKYMNIHTSKYLGEDVKYTGKLVKELRLDIFDDYTDIISADLPSLIQQNRRLKQDIESLRIELAVRIKVEKMKILSSIKSDRKEMQLERIATTVTNTDANIIMLALYHLGAQSYNELTRFVEQPSTIYRHLTELELFGVLKMHKSKFSLTPIGKKYLEKRGITSPNPFKPT